MPKSKCEKCVYLASAVCESCVTRNGGEPSLFIPEADEYTVYTHDVGATIKQCIEDNKPIPHRWLVNYNSKFKKGE